MSDEIGDREKEVLRAVVQEYITTGGPVGSQQLSRKPGFDVSSATLRNVLADLEELGFLEKPHTSAGRVPTDQGYRFYVDTLVRLKEPAPRDRELIHAGLGQEKNVVDMLSEASRVLHSLTRHASVVITPRPGAAVFHRIEFVRLREDRVLAVLVGNGGQVQNKVITVDFPVTSDELLKASNFLSELLREVSLEEARERIRQEMDQEQALYNALTSKALKLGAAATDLDTPESERVRIEGTNSFLEQPEFADVERMRALFKMLDEKHKLLQLLDRVQRAREMQIFIGAESEFSAAGEVTVIASPYGSREQVLGTVGVIGPTRMNYQRVIPLVNFTAQVLSRVLGQD
ncbi:MULTISPECIES: heat-inducible transcriptional repressor HrcA [Stigmatella]|uniref:Heat-inducible transcription repressor HrcA n=2 Tax=Stigmatella TaxID=40 RepID=A0A1H7P0V3_STIAU|nr:MULTISPECIES: heat-inducible transcriptional repressor HrcA [Stigmatella]SEL29256.1 heat-inducible transcription repressor HrcA [Stigmatella aurantiaca]SEU34857.1 heat-inducible transcription repressor HrcA [Stigmatella erecta]